MQNRDLVAQPLVVVLQLRQPCFALADLLAEPVNFVLLPDKADGRAADEQAQKRRLQRRTEPDRRRLIFSILRHFKFSPAPATARSGCVDFLSTPLRPAKLPCAKPTSTPARTATAVPARPPRREMCNRASVPGRIPSPRGLRASET